jgi:hypothetical protein
MEHGCRGLVLATLALAAAPCALAVPAVFDVRYEFTTEDIFLTKFGVQATVQGTAHYSLDQADQLPDDPVSGRYSLNSHRIRIDGTPASDAPNPFGVYTNEFDVLNDLGYAGPPPWYDGFAFGSSFDQPFGAGPTLLEVRVAGLGPLHSLASDALFRLDPADWPDVQGILVFLPAGATQPSDQIGIFDFHLDSLRATPRTRTRHPRPVRGRSRCPRLHRTPATAVTVAAIRIRIPI